MREAVIVSTARTALTKAGRGALNDTHGIKMAGHAIKGAIERAGIDPKEVEDVFLGSAQPEGATVKHVRRDHQPVLLFRPAGYRQCGSHGDE